eukprot:m.121592 g.121592  ORF g.121592 m.121592 type:complete len:469 (+) comp14402_c0_seq3:321-1727(+)
MKRWAPIRAFGHRKKEESDSDTDYHETVDNRAEEEATPAEDHEDIQHKTTQLLIKKMFSSERKERRTKDHIMQQKLLHLMQKIQLLETQQHVVLTLLVAGVILVLYLNTESHGIVSAILAVVLSYFWYFGILDILLFRKETMEDFLALDIQQEQAEKRTTRITSASSKKKAKPSPEHVDLTQIPSVAPVQNDDSSGKVDDYNEPLPPHPIFSSLKFRSLSPLKDMAANTRKPIRFKNDFFDGCLIMILRSKPLDPHFKHFNDNERWAEFQIQGKFLQKPQGTLFCGGELQEKMELGVMIRGISSVVLGIVRRVSVGEMHHSFGDAEERPCIVTNFYNFMERLVITPNGEDPPTLGGAIPENDKDRAQRRKTKVAPEIDLSSTYTFEFHTKFVDVLGWKVMNFPGLSSYDLRSFWKDQPVQFVLYDLVGENKTKHDNASKRYFFNFEIGNNGSTDQNVEWPAGTVFPDA